MTQAGKKFFSIVIPTRDRPHFVKDSIESALNQEFDDYEIIISDNSTDNRTQKIVSEFSSEKIKYFRTPRPLDMPSSWEFAISKAIGKFIIFLADDDVLPSKALKTYQNIIHHKENKNTEVFYSIWAVLDTTKDDERKKKLFIYKKYEKNVFPFLKIPAKQHLKKELSMGSSTILSPHASAIKKDFYESIKKKYGRCFFKWAPDLTFGFIATYELAIQEKNLCRIYLPLLLARTSKESYGYGSKHNPEKVIEFLNQFDDFKGKFIFSPYKKLFILSNGIYDSFLNAFNIVGKDIIKVVGKQTIRDFERRIFMRMLEELEEISKYNSEYIKHLKKIKRDFAIWKIKQFVKGILIDREYVKEVILRRTKKLLKLKSNKEKENENGFEFEINHFHVIDHKEAIEILDDIIEKF